MFCPRCASNQSDDTKFCKACGANLQAVRQAVAVPETEKSSEYAEAWWREMILAPEKHKLELERLRGITPEVRRYNEIKAGVITSSVGIAVSIFLYVLMKGIVGSVSPQDAEILSRVWVAGVIPFFVGIGIIVNGVVVSKKLVELASRNSPKEPGSLEGDSNPRGLRSADTSEFVSSPFSVTEQTTRHLSGTKPK